MTFEVCLFLVIIGVVGVFVTLWKGLIANTSLDFLRKKSVLGVLLEPPCWGSPGVGKVYPAAQLGCDVCGRWTPGKTCSDCLTWAEVQLCHYEKKLPSFDLALREHKRVVDGRRSDGLYVSHTHAPCNEAEHRRLVKAAGW